MAAPLYVHFDIYLSGVSAPGASRAELLKRIESAYRLDRAEAAAFVASGQRIRLRRGVDQDAAMRAIVELQGLGAVVEIEPNRPPADAIDAIDQLHDDNQPPPLDVASPEVQELRRALRSMGGSTVDDKPGGVDTRGATPMSLASTGEHSITGEITGPTNPLPPRGIAGAAGAQALQTLDGADPFAALTPSADSFAPLTASAGSFAPLTAPADTPSLDLAPATAASSDQVLIGRESTAETDPAHDARFLPPSHSVSLQIEIDVAPPPRATPPTDAGPSPATGLPAHAAEAAGPRLCDEHRLPEPCRACAEAAQPIPGRLMQGALRQKPGLRIGLGLGLGLLLGYLASAPYADRAERRVAEVRAEANADRYKNALDAQANVLALDRRAEEMSKNAALGTIAIWLLAGGAVVAGWFRVT